MSMLSMREKVEAVAKGKAYAGRRGQSRGPRGEAEREKGGEQQLPGYETDDAPKQGAKPRCADRGRGERHLAAGGRQHKRQATPTGRRRARASQQRGGRRA